jgi:hypothetical protein
MADERAISTYDDLVTAFRARKDELGLSNTLCDELLNRPSGYTDHYLGRADKSIGPIAFILFCELFALEFVPRQNLAAASRMEPVWERRNNTQVRVRPLKVSKAVLDLARPFIRAEMARHASNARWAKWREARGLPARAPTPPPEPHAAPTTVARPTPPTAAAAPKQAIRPTPAAAAYDAPMISAMDGLDEIAEAASIHVTARNGERRGSKRGQLATLVFTPSPRSQIRRMQSTYLAKKRGRAPQRPASAF